jgi:hypothetical protein
MSTRFIARSGVGTVVTVAVGCAVADGDGLGVNAAVGGTVTPTGLDMLHPSKNNKVTTRTTEERLIFIRLILMGI